MYAQVLGPRAHANQGLVLIFESEQRRFDVPLLSHLRYGTKLDTELRHEPLLRAEARLAWVLKQAVEGSQGHVRLVRMRGLFERSKRSQHHQSLRQASWSGGCGNLGNVTQPRVRELACVQQEVLVNDIVMVEYWMGIEGSAVADLPQQRLAALHG